MSVLDLGQVLLVMEVVVWLAYRDCQSLGEIQVEILKWGKRTCLEEGSGLQREVWVPSVYEFIHSFIHLYSNILLNVYVVPTTDTDAVPSFTELAFSGYVALRGVGDLLQGAHEMRTLAIWLQKTTAGIPEGDWAADRQKHGIARYMAGCQQRCHCLLTYQVTKN